MTLLAAVLLIPTALAARGFAGRWLRPGALFAGYWAIAGIAPLVLLGTPRVSVRAVVYLAAAVVLYSAGALIVTGLGSPVFKVRQVPVLDRQVAVRFAAAGTVAGFVAGLLEIRDHGLSAVTLLSFDGVLETGNAIAVQRYSGQGASYVVAGLLVVTYAAALVAPYARVLDPTIGLRWLMAPFAGALFYSTVTTGKLGLLIAGACIVCGHVAARVLATGDAPKVTRRGVTVTVAAAAVVTVAFTAIMFVRLGRVDATSVPIVQDKLATYAFGYEPGFSEWLERYEDSRVPPLGWGTASVAGVGVLAGQSRSDTRAYDERVVIDDRGTSTNIYTMFRGLLLDFGTGGAAVAVFLLGLVTGLAFRRTALRGSLSAALVLGCLYVVVVMSHIMSIVTFTNVCAAMVLAWGVLLWAARSHPVVQRSRGAAYSARISR